MHAKAMPLALLLALLTAVATGSDVDAPNTWPLRSAANCIAESAHCRFKNARHTHACTMKTMATAQVLQCQALACTYCARYAPIPAEFPCDSYAMRVACAVAGRKMRRRRVMRDCVWTAGERDEIVMDLSRVRPASGWTPTARGAYAGLVYETEKTLGIDPPRRRSKMCFRARARSSGDYHLAALSYAPHGTEHNDVWVRSSLGFGLWQGDKWRDASKYEWLKAYQNKGVDGIATTLSTKDHDGHSFVVHNVEEGKVFKICIAGRSYKYEMFRLILAKCPGDSCSGAAVRDMKALPPSACRRK